MALTELRLRLIKGNKIVGYRRITPKSDEFSKDGNSWDTWSECNYWGDIPDYDSFELGIIINGVWVI
jgi:hypothetical protein